MFSTFHEAKLSLYDGLSYSMGVSDRKCRSIKANIDATPVKISIPEYPRAD